MKRIYSFLLALWLLTICAIPASASLYENDTIEGKVDFETVILGGEEITVPIIIQDMNLIGSYCLQEDDSEQTYGQTIIYCIPATAEALENNEALVQSYDPEISRPATLGFPFLNGYLWISTTIYYSYRPPQKAPYTPNDYNYRLEGVEINRDKDPGGVGTPIWGIDGNPVVSVHLRGGQEFGGPMEQENTYTLNWGKKKDISADFNMVVRSNISSGYAEFLCYIINESGRKECKCPHHFVV